MGEKNPGGASRRHPSPVPNTRSISDVAPQRSPVTCSILPSSAATASAIGRKVVDIAAWLRSLGLEQYEQTFRDNAIGGDVLPALRDEHLKELGLPLGHRLKLVNAIAALHVRASEQVPTAPIPPSLAMQGERRQVTVLFADLAGYTALSNELDPEEILALLERFFDRVDWIVKEHRGHIDRHIGDCVMAIFGAPIAHGNDAERAIRAALAIREAIPELSARLGRPLGVHIGVAGGQVVASGIGN